jgi:hypothetical protein
MVGVTVWVPKRSNCHRVGAVMGVCGRFRDCLWGWLGVNSILERTVCSGVHKGQREFSP